MKNKIILGSANFNQTYGIKRNSIKTKEIKKLLNYALEKKIKLIDTSPLYHQSEKIIGKLNNSRFKIISKIPKKPKKIKKKEINKWLRQSVMSSLKNLKIRKFECLLLQDAKSLLSENGNEIYKSINSIKKNLFTKKIGISIYEFKILEKILKRFKFDEEKIGAYANTHAINPFISHDPLPNNLSSLIVASKGSVAHPLETGTTSV